MSSPMIVIGILIDWHKAEQYVKEYRSVFSLAVKGRPGSIIS